jgi:hypothetical protein
MGARTVATLRYLGAYSLKPAHAAREISGPAGPSVKRSPTKPARPEDRMQAFLWRHLVPAQDFKALVFDPSYEPPAQTRPARHFTDTGAGTAGTALRSRLRLPARAGRAVKASDPSPVSSAICDSRIAWKRLCAWCRRACCYSAVDLRTSHGASDDSGNDRAIATRRGKSFPHDPLTGCPPCDGPRMSKIGSLRRWKKSSRR